MCLSLYPPPMMADVILYYMMVHSTKFIPCCAMYTTCICIFTIKFQICSKIRTHGSGSYVGLASWAWFSIERFKTVTKRCLYSPARM